MSLPTLSTDLWQVVRDGSAILLLCVAVVTGLRGDWIPKVWHQEIVGACQADVQERDARLKDLDDELAAARGELRRLLAPVGGGGSPRAGDAREEQR